jgi:3-phenylpropionate/trans-cinnamate dioxygenase ferredoxin subunit
MGGEWIDLGAAQEITESRCLSVEVDDIPLIIVRCGAELYAVENRCTHDGETLAGGEIEQCEIICPRHGARFCLKSGAAFPPPATARLPTFTGPAADGRILLERPT